MEFPKWQYHRRCQSCIVHSQEEQDALGAGWADSPTAFTEPESATDLTPQHGFTRPKNPTPRPDPLPTLEIEAQDLIGWPDLPVSEDVTAPQTAAKSKQRKR